MKYVFLILGISLIGALFLFQKNDPLKSASNNRIAPPSTHTPLIVAVVPHHDIVKDKRQELLNRLSFESQPEAILLLSPNHFDAGRKPVLTADRVWQLQGGAEQLDTDRFLVEQLLKEDSVERNSDGIRNDHGITNLLGDIHEFFPKARLVPVLLRDTISADEVKKLTQAMYQACDGRCGIIASVDMSHYQTARAADIHDVKTLRALEALDDDAIWNVEVDSRASLAFLIDWAQRISLPHFTLFDHTNSGELAGNFEYETTSHIFGYYDFGESEKRDSRVTFSIAGGISSCETNKLRNELLSDFGSRTLWGVDLPFAFWSTDSKSFSLQDRLVRAWHWPQSTTPANAAMIDDVSVQKMVIGEMRATLLSADESNIALETIIRREKSMGEFVIVLPRWKGVYQNARSEEQRKRVVLWIRAGADLIVGFHEGGLQDIEIIDGVPVFYSVGEFLEECGVANGLVIHGVIEKEKLRIAFDPLQAEGFNIRIFSGRDRLDILQQICPLEIPQCSHGYMEVSSVL